MEHDLLKAVNYKGDSTNNDTFCIGMFFDLKKAFAVVSHKILQKNLMNWASKGPHFSSSTTEAKLLTYVNGKISSSIKLILSVLQGSILGPILFLCFIDDLFKSTNLLALMFADDACCLDSDENLDDLIHRVNVEKKTKISVVQMIKSNKSIPARPNI
jgi:hypothetical protein